MRRVLLAGLGAAILSGGATGALAASVPPLIAAARLTGQFQLTGRVTVAVRIRGERVGQTGQRTWIFSSTCPSGPCPTVGLVRQRATGTDSLVLTLISPGYYEGNGKFYVPLRCGGRVYPLGESVPFTIRVHVTAATLLGTVPVATAISAKYTNHSRRNLTRCIAIPGHDAAVYKGQLVPPSGGSGV